MSVAERKFKFHYGEFDDTAELVVMRPSNWNGLVPAKLVLVAHAGAWRRLGGAPDTTLSKAMVRAAEKTTGLKLALRVAPWKVSEHRSVTREVVLRDADDTMIRALFPVEVRA
jgi:hypothetical protein